jgi:hypothetical protein
MPYQNSRLYSGNPASFIPGRSGTSGERSRVLTASARSFPPLAWGSTEGDVPNVSCVSPAMTDWMAGAPPL